jgi:hypothetical protein
MWGGGNSEREHTGFVGNLLSVPVRVATLLAMLPADVSACRTGKLRSNRHMQLFGETTRASVNGYGLRRLSSSLTRAHACWKVEVGQDAVICGPAKVPFARAEFGKVRLRALQSSRPAVFAS